MGTWGPGNFEDDGALDYRDELTDGWMKQLTATVEDCFAGTDRSALDEDGEAMIVPSVAIMADLCERYRATPPRARLIAQWQEAYLAIYDDQIDGREPKPDFKRERRQTIDETFTRMAILSQEYWERLDAAEQMME